MYFITSWKILVSCVVDIDEKQLDILNLCGVIYLIVGGTFPSYYTYRWSHTIIFTQ